MNARPFGHVQLCGLRFSSPAYALAAALICLPLVLALFLGSVQPASAQDPGIVCQTMILYPSTLPGSAMGNGYSQVVEVVNRYSCCYTYPIRLTVIRGSLPTGLTITQSTDTYSTIRGVLSGTTVAPGTYSFTIHAKDSGGDNAYFCDGAYTVTVGGVNHAPTFTAGGDVTVDETDHDAPYSARWATNLSPGGSADVGQSLTFHVSNDNNGLFAVQPAITPDGVLVFTLKSSTYGSATVSAYVQDNGGTANGGVDRSPEVTFQINVTSVDQPQAGPVFRANSTAWANDHACTLNDCTLREAIEAANLYGGNPYSGPPAIIELTAGAVYAVDGVDNASEDSSPNGLPQVTANITINGHGARIVRSPTAPDARLFDVAGGFLTLDEVALENGRAGRGIYSSTAGGAILDRGRLVVKNSYFFQNYAQYGSAMFNPGGPQAWIYNSTFYANESSGGTISSDGTLDLYNNTFYDNIGVTASALRLTYGTATKYHFFNNLFISSDPSVPLCDLGAPDTTMTAAGNLATDSSCGRWIGVTTLAAVKAMAPPALNGGPTPNIALQAGSTAVDIGDATACQDPNIGGRDQRRYARFKDGNGDHVAACDAGAYEYASVLLPPPAPGGSPYLPEVSVILDPAAPDGSNGWYRSPVTVTTQVSEAVSDASTVVEVRCVLDPAVAPTEYDDLPQALCPFLGGKAVDTDGAHTFYAAAMDMKGRKGLVVSQAVPVDTTPPVITCPAAGPFLLDSGVHTVGPAAVDAAVSGLDEAASTLTGTVNTASPGAKTVTFTARDLAGNTATQKCAYAVVGGFYPPVAPAPALNGAKAGSAVPVKFSLGGSAGLGIAPGYPASQAVTCDSRTPAGSLQPVATNGASGLRYDAATGRYDLVWKTDKAWAGSCRALVLQLTNGAEFRAYFQFK